MIPPLLITNGTIVDPGNNVFAKKDILVEDGKITHVGESLRSSSGARSIDASDMIILPGLVDMHVHLREPGREDKETISSGSRAALKGGVTSCLAMPNTDPACDTPQRVRALRDSIERSARCRVYAAGCITEARRGQVLVDIRALKEAGVRAITDDGNSVDSQEIMLAGLKAASEEGIPLIAHCEDKALAAKGVVNKGFLSTSMGLRGISKESEYARVERDVRLAQSCKGGLHIAHVSCAESVEIIAKAKKRGVRITAETAPHYIALTDEAVGGFDPNFKMNPPLRSSSDREAIKQALRDGTIDVIASDHAPHTENEKEIEFERAEFGVIGLETALSVCIGELLEPGILSWLDLARLMSYAPSRILGLNAGTLGAGAEADIAIVSPGRRWTVTAQQMVSKSKNSPFLNRELHGVVTWAIVRGEVVYCEAPGEQRV